ncbi:MAG: PQQ-binding-like beta-propeller repeat protein, partial [Elusimicrobia bacterium]|nr:PQQ-binding-like beta-propeller repeat protein [Elusimicrobiota bacterium]
MRKLLLALAASFFAAGPAWAAGPDASTWPMMHGGPQRVSTSTVTGPRQIKRSWVQSLGAVYSRSYAGAVLGSDNTIYVGGHEIFYALNPDGTVKWTANEQASGGETFGQPGVADNSRVYVSTLGNIFAYGTGGSGAVTFVSSAALYSPTPRSSGSGAVLIAPNGNVLVSHGDEQKLPGGTGAQDVLSAIFTPSLASKLGMFANGPSSPYYRSGFAVTADGAKACATQNQGANTTMFCRDTTTGASADYVTADYVSAGVNTGVSFRADGSAVLLAYNQFATNCPSLGSSSYYLAAQNANGTTRWRNCDMTWSSGYFRAPVSSAPTTTFVFDAQRTSVYAIDDSTGGIRWSYPLPTTSVSPLTLAGGTTLYLTYCDTPGTRLVALNANTGSLFWDVVVSTAGSCYMGQPVPGTGKRMYILNGPETIAVEDVDVSSLTVVLSSPTMSGNLWITTFTISAKDSLSAATSSGVPVEATVAYNFGTIPAFSPASAGFTDTAGNAVFTLQFDINSLPHGDYATMRSTVSFKSNGLVTSSFTAYEYRAASYAVSVSTPSIEDDGTGRLVQVTTLTFTVSNSTGGRVSNYPVALDRTNFTGVCNATMPESSLTPAANYYLTDSTGQARIAYRLRYTESGNILCTPALALPNVNPTVNAYALGLPSQALSLADARSSTFTVSYSSAILQSDVRHTTMTVTVYGVAGSTVPGTVVVLKDMVAATRFLYGFNGLFAGPTVTCGGSAIAGFTDSLGQAKFNIDGRNCGAHPFDNYSDFLAS